MPKREVDKRKTTKALRKLRKVVERTSAEGAPQLTAWEQEFVSGVSQRLETYGSAFRDLSKGRAEEALSVRQSEVARVIERKSRPKLEKTGGDKTGGDKIGGDEVGGAAKDKTPAGRKEVRKDARKDGQPDKDQPGGLRRSTFRRKTPLGKGPRVRDINDDPVDAAPPTADPAAHIREPTEFSRATTARRPNPAANQLKSDHLEPPPGAPRQSSGAGSARPSLRLIKGGKSGD